MALERTLNRRVIARIAFGLLIIACIAPLLLRSILPVGGPSVEIVTPQGVARTVTLSEMLASSLMTREGSYQNQYGNWRDRGMYTGVRLSELIANTDYASIEIVARDGYRMTMDRTRVDDAEYPMVLAFRMDGEDVPDWEDGFRIVTLPADGGTSNADYGVESAGSYWVKRVRQLVLR